MDGNNTTRMLESADESIEGQEYQLTQQQELLAHHAMKAQKWWVQ